MKRLGLLAAAFVATAAPLAVVGPGCVGIVGVGNIVFVGDAGDAGDAGHAAPDAKSAHDAAADGTSPGSPDAGCVFPALECNGSCVEPKGFAADPSNCGACGHSCGGGRCVGSACQPVAMAGADLPNGIAVDMMNVYWTNTGPTTGGSGTLMKLPVSGGNAVTLASGQEAPYGVAVDAKNIYWTNFCGAGGTAGGACNVMQAGLDGANATTIALNQSFPAGIALDETNVYWASYGGDINYAPKGAGALVTVAMGIAPSGIAVCGSNLYWTDQTAGYVYQVMLPAQASSPSNKVSVAAVPFSVACHGANIYWANAGNTAGEGALVAFGPGTTNAPIAEIEEQTPVPLSSNNVYPNATFASDGSNLFYVDTAAGTVSEIVKGTQNVIVLASSEDAPFSIALYPPGQTGKTTAVYWVNRGPLGAGGAVMKIVPP